MNSGECCDLWRVDVDGSEQEYVTALNGSQTNFSYFDIGENDAIFCNHANREAQEVWLAVSGESDSD